MIIDDVKKTLKSLGVNPQKEKGQNFLIDPAAVQEIVRFGRPERGGSVVEIGPGLGALTAELLDAEDLTVIEIEHNFCEYIKKRFPSVNVIEEDVRLVDFSELGEGLTVFGNLPYSISTDVILHLSQFANCFKRAVIMLQKEFAERLAAKPACRDYGVITITCQMYADVRLGPVIKGDSFWPQAAVDSQVLELRFLPAPRCAPKDPYIFNRLIAAAFHERRKKIINSVRKSVLFSSMDVASAMQRAEIEPSRRAETLTIAEYCRLSDELSQKP
ncbi:MAG: 16S rRNA (adenine(1518)-N(6)/adenine(1519)-N(6))-dimethyltransferase RsmA [Bdellovibrionota bacterium]|jgi:16S rRNA (adenine1518-N6/adenine1519-N6)-dimethyltransferase